jgi:tetratricopeptide (TPR) repeat protein
METYRLKSKLVENDKEFVIQTINDVNQGEISSTVYVNQQQLERTGWPYPQGITPEEVLSLVKMTHGEKKKELETLLENYRKVISGHDPEMMYHLGVAFYYKRLYNEAEELLRSAVALDPDHHQAYNYLGMTQHALNKPAEAVEACRHAVQKCPGYADYRNNLGEALLSNRSCHDAIKEFEEAVRINLYYADAYLNLGLAHTLQALVEGEKHPPADTIRRATDYFKKASLICTDYDPSVFNEGLQALQEADFRRAFSIFHRLRENKKEKHRREFAAFYVKLAMHPEFVTEEVINDRIRFLEAEITKNPTYIDLYAELGRCLLERAKFSWHRGLEQYRKALDLNPSLTKARYCCDEAEKEYENICATLGRIVEKN